MSSERNLLAKGKTSGQAMRLLVDPVKRMYEIKAEEEAAEKEREAKQNSKVNMLLQQKGGGSAKATPAETPAPGAGEEEEEEEEEQKPPTPEPTMNRSWYNMVCYGLPNLMVTQLSKP